MANTASLRDKLVVLMGGSGFLGNYVAQALLKHGARLRIVSRNPQKAFSLKPLANLGQLHVVHSDITDHERIEASVHGAHAVINLVGSFDGDLMNVMGRAAGHLAQASQAAGAQAFIHISAIGANGDSAITYAKAKAAGEAEVREAFPGATVIRPSVIFGEDDNFINMFAGLIRSLPVLPVFGPDKELQIVHANDIAKAILSSVADPSKYGKKIFELGGPENITMMDIHNRIAQAQRRDRHFIPMPDSVSSLFASIPFSPMSKDQWGLLEAGNVASGKLPGFEAFGIQPQPLDLFLDRWMVSYRKHGRFTETSNIAA